MIINRVLLILIFVCLFTCSFSQSNTLDYFLEQALSNSPLLKDYKNQVLANQQDSLRIRAVNKPQVNGNSFNYYAPTINGYGYDFAVTNGAQVTALVGVSQQIVSRDNLNTQFRSIQLLNESLGNSTKITQQDLKRTVSSQYITAFSDLQLIQFVGDIIALLQKEEVILKQLTEKNVYRQSEYLTFLVALKQQELNYRQVRLQYRNDYALLNYLSGIYDTSGVDLRDPDIQLNIPSEQAHSVFFHQFLTDSLKLVNSRDLVDFSYRPKLSLFADGGYLSSLAYRPYKNFGVSAGASLFVPIYDGHQRKLQYNKLSIAEQTRSNYKEFFSRQYNQQLAQFRQQLKGTEELRSEIKAQVDYSESLIKVNARLLETGDVRIADYIIALNSYLNAKYLLTQNNITRLQIINQINYWNR